MSTIMTSTVGGASESATASGKVDMFSVALWLAAALVGVFFAALMKESAVVDGLWLPRSNDSLYHARRILDTIAGSEFYQFDQRLHAPDGSWVTWPWAYDYLMAKAATLALTLNPTLDPMAFLAYVPVAWVVVNAALFLAILNELGVSREMRVIAMLCFALSPLTQALHSIAMIDHHYVEHTFVLLNVWLGMRWFRAPASIPRAAALGIGLGVAPAFHIGLFILQLVPLTAIFVSWLRGFAPPLPTIRVFAATLLITTQLILLPSEPYRHGMFEFGLLSWFHFYVAVCTALAAAFMGWRSSSRRNLALLAGLCLALAAPLAAQALSGAGFITGSFSILAQISEVHSPYTMFTQTFGAWQTASFYSWLVLAAPALLVFFAYRVLRERDGAALYYAVAAAFGLFLLLQQFRLHYFGFFALAMGTVLVVDRLRQHFRWHRGATFAVALGLFALTYQPSLRDRLFVVYSPGGAPDYASLLPLYLDLGAACAADPGVVLASTDDGNGVLFHSDCSVIANNFILRPEDDAHINELWRLMNLSPAELIRQRPDVKYLLLRARDFVEAGGGLAELSKTNAIAQELLTSALPPPGLQLLKTINWELNEQGDTTIFARLYKVLPSDAGPPRPDSE